MEVTVDGVIIDDTFVEDETTIEDTLKHVQDHLCQDDQLVVGVHCNGEDVPAQEMAATLKKPANSFASLAVFTGTRSSLVSSAMKEAATCLTGTEDACRQTATLLTEGKTVEAAQTLGECLRIWQQVHEAVGKSIEMLQLDPSQVQVNDSSLIKLIGQPKEVLLQMKTALLAQDFVLLADILEYELDEVIKNWSSIVQVLEEQAQAHIKADPA